MDLQCHSLQIVVDNGDTVDSVVLSGDVEGFVIEGSLMYFNQGDLHGFDTNKVADDPSYVDLIKSDKFTSSIESSSKLDGIILNILDFSNN